jgi:hypothetical protein
MAKARPKVLGLVVEKFHFVVVFNRGRRLFEHHELAIDASRDWGV